ncbi:GapS4b family protein [Flavobacterium columnare]|uniref:GapS4b family protein n=1 Tax=Flavobacterium columnare TaxID=996 RepID=UPI0040347CA3
MKKTYENIDKILPYGELIRGFANQNLITNTDLSNSLRNRGVFFGKNEKEFLVPCLTSLVLSPKEFIGLSEKLNTKEDNEKKLSSTINYGSSSNLINEVPRLIDTKEILGKYGNVEIIGAPNFTMVNNNPNHVKIDIEIERNDLNKSWYETKNTFKCSLNVIKNNDNELKIVKTNTSPETYPITRAYEKNLINHLKDRKVINKDEELKKILFNEFNNEHRIVYLIRLSTKLNSSFFEFKDIIDWEFKPDETIQLPEKIDWMTNKETLIMKGRNIHNTFFFEDLEYHKYLKVWSIEARLSFEYELYKGECTVSFGFPEYPTKGVKAEFEINITRFSLNQNLDARDKRIAKSKIFDLLESEKNKIYNNYKEFLQKEN